MSKRRKIQLISLLVIILLAIFLTPRVVDYFQYRNVVAEAAGSSYPWQCGAYQVAAVVSTCAVVNGVCTCASCTADACNNYSMMTFTGQQNCGATYACISNLVQVKGGATTLMECAGKQAILAGTTNINMMAPNALVACPGSVAANNMDKFVNWFDKYIIAGFKDKIK